MTPLPLFVPRARGLCSWLLGAPIAHGYAELARDYRALAAECAAQGDPLAARHLARAAEMDREAERARRAAPLLWLDVLALGVIAASVAYALGGL